MRYPLRALLIALAVGPSLLLAWSYPLLSRFLKAQQGLQNAPSSFSAADEIIHWADWWVRPVKEV